MIKNTQYSAGREMTIPFSSGIFMKDMTLNEMRYLEADLTEEERKSPYASIFYEPLPVKTPEQEAAFKAPLRQDQMYMPCDSGKIMIEHQNEYPTLGYGCMDNGVGYSAIRIDQFGVNDQMIKEYREQFSHDTENVDIFYKNWCPGRHIRHFEDGVIEDFGYGPVVLKMDWFVYSLEHAGISEEYIKEKDPKAINFVLGGGSGYLLWAPEKVQESVMITYTREVENGRQVFIHFWIGVKPGPDGTTIVCPYSDDKGEIEAMMRYQYSHCVTEYTRQLKHMKEFWNQNHPDRKVEV